MSQVTPEMAAELLLKRQDARERLVEFARYVDIPGVPIDEADTSYRIVETTLADHHLLMLETLQDLTDRRLRYKSEIRKGKEVLLKAAPGEGVWCSRVMLMFPPGGAKSTYASVVFPAWYMGNHPGDQIILTGYGDDICKRHGKRARQLVQSSSYKAVFGFGIDSTTKAADDWSCQNGANYKSKGILSGITGFRCAGLIWDDLVKGRKDADSQGIRDDTYNAYIDDARSRKTPRSWEIAIGTRWHEDDPMGRILPEGYTGESGFIRCRDGNVWYVLCVPAQCERTDDPLGREIGEYLWPEWFGEGFWDDKKINPRSWASLYQQRPAPDEGLYFKIEWFRRYDEVPRDANYYIAYDPAVTSEDDANNADDTVIMVFAVDSQARIYLVDEFVRKCTMDVWIEKLLDFVVLYKPLACISESGVIRRASEPFLKRSMLSRAVFALFEWVHRHANKAAMARAAQAMYAAGQIYHPKTSVGDNVEDEMLRFPTSKVDNRVDAVVNLCLYLENIWASNPPKKQPKKREIGDGIPIKSLMPPRFSKKKSRWVN